MQIILPSLRCTQFHWSTTVDREGIDIDDFNKMLINILILHILIEAV